VSSIAECAAEYRRTGEKNSRSRPIILQGGERIIKLELGKAKRDKIPVPRAFPASGSEVAIGKRKVNRTVVMTTMGIAALILGGGGKGYFQG